MLRQKIAFIGALLLLFGTFGRAQIVSDTVYQLLTGGGNVDSIGHWVSGSKYLSAAPSVFQFTPSSYQVLESTQKLLSAQKYHDWGVSSLVNPQSFKIPGSNSKQIAQLINIYPGVIIRNELIDAPAIDGGTVSFKDPWFIDTTESYGPQNRGASNAIFHSRTSPFHPDTSTSYSGFDYQGVFRNQITNPDSILVAQTQSISTYSNCNFIQWLSSTATFGNANSTQTPVIFQSGTDVVRARYKGHLMSANSAATIHNNQTQVVVIGPAPWNKYAVYESGGCLWYTWIDGTDDSTNWSVETPITLSGIAMNPAIAKAPDQDNVFVVWVEPQGGYYRLMYSELVSGSQTWTTPYDLGFAITGLGDPNSDDPCPSIVVRNEPTVCWNDGNGLAAYFVNPTVTPATPTVTHRQLTTDSSAHNSAMSFGTGTLNTTITWTQGTPRAIWTMGIDVFDSADGVGNVDNMDSARNISQFFSNVSDVNHPVISTNYDTGYVAFSALNTSYSGNSTRSIYYAHIYRNTVLSTGSFVTPGAVYLNPSLAFQESGYQYVMVFYDSTNTKCRVTACPNGNWTGPKSFLTNARYPVLSINPDHDSLTAISLSGSTQPFTFNFTKIVASHMQSNTANATGTNSQRKVVCAANKNLYLVYESDGDIWFTSSTNNGSTWATEQLLSTGSNGYPAITERKDSLYVVWQHADGSNWDIDYVYSNNAGASFSSVDTLITNFACSGTGPLPAICAGSTGNSFELMIAYVKSTGIFSAHTTSASPSPSSWTTIQVNNTNSTSTDPALAYRANSYGYYYIAWDQGSAGSVISEQYMGSLWYSETFLASAPSGAGIYSDANPSFAIDGNYDEFVAFNGYHSSYNEETIVLNKNLSSSVYTEFYDGYYHSYYMPVVTGDSAGRANLLWYDNQSYMYQTTYNGTSWSTPTSYSANAKYPTVTINNPAGGTAYAFATQGSAAPYTIAQTFGALSKTTATWAFARKITLTDTSTGNSVDIQLEAPSITDASGNSTNLTFSGVNDGGTYDATSVWSGLTTAPLTWSGAGTLTAIRTLIVNNRGKNSGNETIPLIFAVLDASTGQVLGSETVPMSEYDTSLAGTDVVSIPFTSQNGHAVTLDVTCAASNNPSRYAVALGNIYNQFNPNATQKKGSNRDRFATAKPKTFSLSNAYPNPFNPTTRISYQLASPGHVTMSVFNILGQQVAKLVDRDMQAGSFTETWNANSAPSGVYFIRVSVSNQFGKSLFRDVKKVMLIK